MKKIKKILKKIFVLSMLFVTLTILLVIYLDKKISPYGMIAADNYVKSEFNFEISKVISEILKEKKLKTSDLYTIIYDENNSVKAIETNTVLINSICSDIVKELSALFLGSEMREIKIPIGIIFNLEILSNVGPNYLINFKPVGAVDVEYVTDFKSAGLNQSNFTLDLIVNTQIKYINPYRSEVINVTRNINLVNSVINGEVPKGYFFEGE